MNNIIKNTIKTILFGIPLVSMVVISDMYFPFITGKNFLFRVAVEICLCLYIALAISDSSYRPKRNNLLIAFASFVGVMFVADVFAVNPTKAFFSNFERMEGFVMLAHMFAYFVVLVSVLKEKKDWMMMIYSTVSVSVFMTLFAFLQFFGGAAINQGASRLDGTLGNSAYLATYLVFHIFFFLYLWVSNGNKIKGIGDSVAIGAVIYILYYPISIYFKNIPSSSAGDIIGLVALILLIKVLFMRFNKKLSKFENIFTAVLYSFVILSQTIVLYYTATRGAILGFIGGLLLSATIIIFTEKENKLIKNIAVGALITILVFVSGFVVFRKADFIQTSPVLNRFANISFSESKTQARGIIWPMAIEAFRENPIIGWGQDNFLFAFAKYYRPEMIAHEPWFDRTHNSFLDWLIAGGILGFVGYISLYIFAITTLIKSTFFNQKERAVLIGLFSAYAFLSMFIFDNLISYMLFVLILGLADARTDENKSKKSGVDKIGAPFFISIIAFAVILILFLNLNSYRQNITLTKSLGQQKEGVSKNLELITDAINFSRVGRFESLEQMSRIAISVLSATGISNDDKNKFALKTIEELDKYTKEYPQDVRGYVLLGAFLSDVGLYTESISVLEKAKELSPKKQQIYYSLAKSYFGYADKENDRKFASLGVETIRIAYDLAPNFEGPKTMYANVLIATGNLPEGIRIIKTMENPLVFADKKVIDLLIVKGFKKDALEILELAKKSNPDKKEEIDSLTKGIR